MNSMNDIEVTIDFSALTPEEFYSRVENRVNLELMLSGIKNYRRQYPIGPYFADFFFPENNLVLEIDGLIAHSTEEQLAHDRRRDKYMNEKGYCVVRAKASLAAQNPSGVLSAIRYIKDNNTYFIFDEDSIKKLIIESVQVRTKECEVCKGKGFIMK